MELNLSEMNAVVAALCDAQDDVKALTELELSLIGGGTGDVTFG